MDDKKRKRWSLFGRKSHKPLYIEITEWEFFLHLPRLCMSRYARNSGFFTGMCHCVFYSRHVGNTIYVDTIVTGTDVTEEQELTLISAIHVPSPIGSMYGIFTYIYHKHQANVGKYTSPMDCMGHVKPISTIFIHVGPVNGPTKS